MKVRYARNRSYRASFRTAIKSLLNAIASGDQKIATALYQATVKKIDQTQQKGLIRKNKAARLKSRLNTKVKQLVS